MTPRECQASRVVLIRIVPKETETMSANNDARWLDEHRVIVRGALGISEVMREGGLHQVGVHRLNCEVARRSVVCLGWG